MQRNRVLIGAVAVALVAGLGFWFGRFKTDNSDKTLGTNQEIDALEGNAIEVDNQASGSRVSIKNVILMQDGWVAIHEDLNGAPGRILGARRFNGAGVEQTGEVELLRGTVANRLYYAMLHADDGDRMFDHTKDQPIRGSRDEIIMTTFSTTAE